MTKSRSCLITYPSFEKWFFQGHGIKKRAEIKED